MILLIVLFILLNYSSIPYLTKLQFNLFSYSSCFYTFHIDLGLVCFSKTGFRETIFQTFLCLFVIRKVGQRKTLSGQRKILSSQF